MANTKTNITAKEQDLLRGYFRTSPLLLIRLKASAVLMWDKGMSQQNIADIVSRSRQTVNEWLRDWHERRMASIFTGHQDNHNADKLTKEQKKAIKQVLQRPPGDYDIARSFWDVPTLKKYIKAEFGIVYESNRSYHFLLKFSNLSFKYPDTFDRRRDEERIKSRMAQIRSEIAPLLKNKQWEVFSTDEVRIELTAEIRRAWLKKGQRTVIKVNRKKEAQSYLGLLNQKTYRCDLYRLTWQNQAEVIKACKRLLKKYPQKKIAVIWDNAAFHKGKDIRATLKRGQALDRIHLIPMPPYAPDENPIEKVWNVGKKSIANLQADTFDETKKRFEKFVKGRKFEYVV